MTHASAIESRDPIAPRGFVSPHDAAAPHDVAAPVGGGWLDASPNPEERTWLGLNENAWIKIGIVAVLMAAVFWPNLRRLWLKTNPFTGDANWGHAICIPFICLYYLYVNRERLLSARPAPTRFKLGTWLNILSGVCILIYYVCQAVHLAGPGAAVVGAYSIGLVWLAVSRKHASTEDRNLIWIHLAVVVQASLGPYAAKWFHYHSLTSIHSLKSDGQVASLVTGAVVLCVLADAAIVLGWAWRHLSQQAWWDRCLPSLSFLAFGLCLRFHQVSAGLALVGGYSIYLAWWQRLRRAPPKPAGQPQVWRQPLRHNVAFWAHLGCVILVSLEPYAETHMGLPSVSTNEVFLNLGYAASALGVLTLLFDWGLGITLFGLLTYGFGIWPGQNDFVKDFGMVATLFGVVLMLAGWDVMKVAWFAIAFLMCAIPWPGLFYSQVAGPLQHLAAKVAVWTLNLTGVESECYGTKIFIKGFGDVVRTLNVEEACAGLRSLMTFVSVGGAVAFLSGRPLWQKLLITVMAVPIAVACNVMRVSGQGLLDHYWSQQLSEGFAHQFVGMIMLIPAFVLILLVGWVLDQVFLDELDQHSGLPGLVRHRQTVAAIPASRPATSTGRPASKLEPASKPAAVVSKPAAAPMPGRSLAQRRAQLQAAAPAKTGPSVAGKTPPVTKRAAGKGNNGQEAR